MQEVPQELIKQAARGDIEAFEKIYRLTQSFVYSVAYRVNNNTASSDDVTQEVFLKMHKSLNSFRFASSFKTWLYRVTMNTAINHYRRNRRDSTIAASPEIVIEHERNAVRPGDIVEKQDGRRILEELLAKLNPDQRACVVLREIEGLNYKEIARSLNVKINTVRSRLKRARVALMAYAKNEVADELQKSARVDSWRLY
jgi:RNA polymerase sigma-70 factor (ECF subfamily)